MEGSPGRTGTIAKNAYTLRRIGGGDAKCGAGQLGLDVVIEGWPLIAKSLRMKIMAMVVNASGNSDTPRSAGH